MNLHALEALASEWESEASIYRHRGHEQLAEMSSSYARDLRERLQEWWLHELTLQEAAAELGVTTSAIQKRVQTGTLTSGGKKGSPRFRRCDLHGGRRTQPPLRTEDGTPDVAEEVLRALG
jgi:hypothetical protein